MRRLLITGGSGFIGSNYIEKLKSEGISILNVDAVAPINKLLSCYWSACDILSRDNLLTVFEAFRPTHVMHMAARTDCVEDVDVHTEYRANIEGTSHVLDAVGKTRSVERLIVCSSQYVCGPDHYPKDMEDYGPHTAYGQSKVLTEQLTKKADPTCVWTIIRPVNIWGPWHLRYEREAWRVIHRRLYLHPAGSPVRRCYGYVGNVIGQIEWIFSSEPASVHRQTFYVGDPAIDIYEWVSGFSLALTGRPARKAPRALLRAVGRAGDVINGLPGGSFPLTTSRYRSMTQDYLTPIEDSLRKLGPPLYALHEGIEETVGWLQSRR